MRILATDSARTSVTWKPGFKIGSELAVRMCHCIKHRRVEHTTLTTPVEHTAKGKVGSSIVWAERHVVESFDQNWFR
jgi:hypothetical protein